jgi:hypothetical protein
MAVAAVVDQADLAVQALQLRVGQTELDCGKYAVTIGTAGSSDPRKPSDGQRTFVESTEGGWWWHRD